jgi:hypothetical protein
MKTVLATVLAACVCFAWSAPAEATPTDASPPQCDWIKAEKAENLSSGVKIAQIDHCCVGTRRCPPPNENLTECAFACHDMMDNCTGKLIRTGFPHIAFDGYTSDDCITFILSTPWCVNCP